MWFLKQPTVGERCFCMVDKISENELKMSSKSIQKPAQKSSTILSKIEVNSEEGLISCGQVCHDTPGVKFARERRGFGRIPSRVLSNTPTPFQGRRIYSIF